MRPFTLRLTSRNRVLLILGALSSVFPGAIGCASTARELIVFNARVWTGPQTPEASAFLVRDGHFVAVGAEDAVRAAATRGARTLDVEGRRVVPGLIDAHLHLLGGGRQLGHLDLRHIADRQAFVDSIARAAGERRKPGAWLLGGRWSTESWPDSTQPRRDWIDAKTRDVPVLLHRMDGHAALANAVALKIAGIDATGPADPPGGLIERDPTTGEPTGILKESAIELVAKRVPALSAAQLSEALDRAAQHALANGLTCVHTMEDWNAFETFDRARRSGALPIRIRQYLSEPDWIGMLPRAQRAEADDRLRIVGFKEYADGSLGSRTAYMAAPYTHTHNHDPNAHGLLREAMLDQKRLEKMCKTVYDAGFAPAIHAIGDEANHEVLDIYSRIVVRERHQNGVVRDRSVPWPAPRIEHAQHLLPEDIRRFADIPVTASMQPLHKADDGRYAEQAIGAERCGTSYAYRSLLDSGALVCFGSDWPVVSLNPFRGMASAVSGRTLDGKTFVPEQNIPIEAALTAYTAGAAEASLDNQLGRISQGALADFVILDRDILSVPADQIAGTRVVATYVGGEVAYSAPQAAPTNSAAE